MKNLVYKVLEPKQIIANTPLLFMLHGYGSNEDDLFSFADELNDRFLVISLRAPRSLHFGGYAWYDIDFTGISSRFGNPEQALESLEMVFTIIVEMQAKYNADKSRTVIMGFSQGAILCNALSLRFPELIGSVVAMSGYVFNEIMPKQINSQLIDWIEYFVSHGIQDEVIPIEWAHVSVEWMKRMRLHVEYHEYNMGHGINPQCFYDMMAWIASRYPILSVL